MTRRYLTHPYRLWLTNFHYYVDGDFSSLDEAVAAAKTKGFEVAIHFKDGGGTTVVGSWSPIGGLRNFRNFNFV